MGKYAAKTDVSSERSIAEIQKTLTRYGATSFGYAYESTRAQVVFSMAGRRIRFELELPDKTHHKFTRTAVRNWKRTPVDSERAWEQATRQKWRALALAVKAKLEAVDSGIATFEEEFLAYVVLPNGKSVGMIIAPQLDEIYASGKMPLLLGDGDSIQ